MRRYSGIINSGFEELCPRTMPTSHEVSRPCQPQGAEVDPATLADSLRAPSGTIAQAFGSVNPLDGVLEPCDQGPQQFWPVFASMSWWVSNSPPGLTSNGGIWPLHRTGSRGSTRALVLGPRGTSDHQFFRAHRLARDDVAPLRRRERCQPPSVCSRPRCHGRRW